MAQYNIRFPRFGIVTLLSMWQKGKKDNSARFLVDDGKKKMLLWIADFGEKFSVPVGQPFYGKASIEYAEYDDCIVKSPTHIKNGNYNYYLMSNKCEPEFEAMLVEYEASDPLVAEKETGGPGLHCDYSRVTYKLWEKI